MAVLLALGCAVVYGASDFLGGLASRRTSVFGVVALSQAGRAASRCVALLPWLGGPVERRRPRLGRGGRRRGRRPAWSSSSARWPAAS